MFVWLWMFVIGVTYQRMRWKIPVVDNKIVHVLFVEVYVMK